MLGKKFANGLTKFDNMQILFYRRVLPISGRSTSDSVAMVTLHTGAMLHSPCNIYVVYYK